MLDRSMKTRNSALYVNVFYISDMHVCHASEMFSYRVLIKKKLDRQPGKDCSSSSILFLTEMNLLERTKS